MENNINYYEEVNYALADLANCIREFSDPKSETSGHFLTLKHPAPSDSGQISFIDAISLLKSYDDQIYWEKVQREFSNRWPGTGFAQLCVYNKDNIKESWDQLIEAIGHDIYHHYID